MGDGVNDGVNARLHLLQDFFDTLHSLWHQHGCAPGHVEWGTVVTGELAGQATVNTSAPTKAVALAKLIRDITGEWPLPCGICHYWLRREEETRRKANAIGTTGTSAAPVRYYYINPDRDHRQIELRICVECGQKWTVRIPSVAEAWASCPSCEARHFLVGSPEQTNAKP